MAQDTFLRDWVVLGESDPRDIVRHLHEIKEKYGTITAFFVSEHTGRYYYADGILKTVSPREPRDAWYYRVRNMQAPYETNVDPDMANRDALTVFINYQVFDFKGNFIGTTGVGLTMNAIGRIIDSYQSRFKRQIFFVDEQGKVKLSDNAMPVTSRSIREMSGISSIAASILANREQASRLHYVGDNGNVWVNSRYLKEIGLFLVVEQDEKQILAPMVRVFWINLAVSTLVTLLVLLLALYALNRYQKMEDMATFDQLTQLYTTGKPSKCCSSARKSNPGATSSRYPCCWSTWISSKTSMTLTATWRVTAFCARFPAWCAACCATAMCWCAGAARNSSCCCAAANWHMHSASRKICAKPLRHTISRCRSRSPPASAPASTPQPTN